jgi:hypothetical protein
LKVNLGYGEEKVAEVGSHVESIYLQPYSSLDVGDNCPAGDSLVAEHMNEGDCMSGALKVLPVKGQIGVWCCCSLVLLALTVVPALCGQGIQTGDRNADGAGVLVGRVLADRMGPLPSGAGLGPHSKVFIFGALDPAGDGKTLLPVAIEYQFFKSDPPLAKSFFDFSKLYSMRVVRDSRCDVTIDDLAYVNVRDESENSLTRTYILRPLDGAPLELLKPEKKLACYVLHPSDYRVVGRPAPHD